MKYATRFVALALFFCCCNGSETNPGEKTGDTIDRVKDYIKPIAGPSDSIPAREKERGEVLIAYSDCYTCHHVEHRAKGPAFKDIAKRYPVNDGYINLLARRIIAGGSGAWGYSVMSAHPQTSVEDAKLMAKFILSLKE
jgi:cytochrome c